MNKMILGIRDVPKKWYQWILYTIQQVLSVFVATVLIANICGTPISSCLLGACIGTLTYQLITGFKSPAFISSCGATVSAVCGALALGQGNNYLAVAIGGLVIALVYAAFALLVKLGGIKAFNKIFPAIIVGPVTMVIGLNLASFIPTYIGGETIPMLVALFTMFVTAVVSHYCKGFMKTIAFLIGIISGYLVSIVLTVTNVYPLINFDAFNNLSVVALPEFTFLKWNFNTFEWSQVIDVIILFVPVAICACLEHYSDHKTLSNIIEVDLTAKPGLHRTLLGDGVASLFGAIVGGQPNTTYGESVATVGFSKVASVWVITAAAGVLGLLSFFPPVAALVNSIPSCVFGGCAMILYGYIASSGLKTLLASKPDLEDNKNLIVISVILTVGVSGIFLFTQSFKGVALAMVLGIILNLILKSKKLPNKE